MECFKGCLTVLRIIKVYCGIFNFTTNYYCALRYIKVYYGIFDCTTDY